MKRLNLFWKFVAMAAILYPTTRSAQHWVNAAGGGSVESGGIMVDYTIGQVFVGVVADGDVMLTQGFQQGYGPWTNNQGGNSGSGSGTGEGTGSVNAVATISETTATLTLYPNPASNNVRIGLGIELDVPANVWLYAMDGRRVLSRTFAPNQQEFDLDLSSLPAGVYVVRIVAAEQHFNTAKLVKK